MPGHHFKYTILFLLLVHVQVIVFNNVLLGNYLNPQVYVLFILILPVAVKGWLLLLLSFLLGLTIDAFSDSMAIHAASSVFMAFCRPGVIRFVAGRIPVDEPVIPSISQLGGFTIILYSIILIFLHHSLLFFLEIFRTDELMQTLSRILLNSGLTLVFVFLCFALLEGIFQDKRK